MTRIMASAISAALVSAIVPGIVSGDESGTAEPKAKGLEKTRSLSTAPPGEARTRAERERRYRSCLFTYLPRMGSDAAAEMIREACRAEFLGED